MAPGGQALDYSQGGVGQDHVAGLSGLAEGDGKNALVCIQAFPPGVKLFAQAQAGFEREGHNRPMLGRELVA
ncbi:MAG TPA: hypothetical protein VFQ34_08050 [Nitrospiraceae bacterium]|nr:hypothetical protein [Nitrospiraceae bacterium]